MNMQKEFIKKLKSDLEIISDEITEILYKEDVFTRITIPKLRESDIDPHIRTTVTKSHYSDMLTSVRRQITSDQKSPEVSLMKLLLRMRKNNVLITKDWYVKEWLTDSSLIKDNPELAGFIQGIPAAEFKSHFGDQFLDPAIIGKDIAILSEATLEIKAYVDKAIAHRDPSAPNPPSFEKYNNALQELDRIAKKYILLLKQVGMSSLKPVLQ